jgi:hypothetical protein
MGKKMGVKSILEEQGMMERMRFGPGVSVAVLILYFMLVLWATGVLDQILRPMLYMYEALR